jgi:hypothetical protein
LLSSVGSQMASHSADRRITKTPSALTAADSKTLQLLDGVCGTFEVVLSDVSGEVGLARTLVAGLLPDPSPV